MERRLAARRPPATAPPRPAAEATERFRRVIALELRRGCDDSAVIGGLDGFIARARAETATASLLSSAPVPPGGYAAMTKAARERWLRALLAAKPRAAPSRPGGLAEAASPPTPSAPRGTTEATPARARRLGPPSARSPERAAERPKALPPAERLEAPVTAVRGVKAGLQARLAKLGLRTVRDLLFLFPNRHNDFADVRVISDLQVGEEQTCIVSVWSAELVRLGRMVGTQALVGDGSGTMRITWFNQTYLAGQLQPRDKVVLSGKVGLWNGQKTMENPEWERVQGDDLVHTGRLVPVYPLTQGLSQRVLRRAVKEAVDAFAHLLSEPLPPEVRRRQGLPGIVEALRQMHYPDSKEKYQGARRRFAFEELLCMQVVVLGHRAAWQRGRAPAFDTRGIVDAYRSALPFALTGAQERALGEAARDLASTRPMARLLQGDVGSGKTAVAAAALAIAAANGFQGAIMAPTEILAEQHHRTLTGLLGRLRFAGRDPMRLELLTGSLRSSAKRAALEGLAAGTVDVAVGTHALIQEGVSFARLGLTVVDEQHRFGVMQRAALRERAATAGYQTPHLLVMSATPIPRTLALTLFGDLDLSVIDEMPPGRLPVKTSWVSLGGRESAYAFVREKVREGRQAFVVCPLIEASEKVESKAATEEYERLAGTVFPDLRLALLHGRMPGAEKDAVLSAFRRHETDVLVATTVIEVGIDIPNATVMVIEGADRFGLAQLHQLRGRVGRGADQSFCLLLSEDPSGSARQRLEVMESTHDGFALAEADLQLRGPGDYLGTRQSGIPELKVASFSDLRMVEAARREAQDLLAADPSLRAPEHAELARAVELARRVVTGEVS